MEAPPIDPELPKLSYPRDEYIKRLESEVCMSIRRLRKKSRLSQRAVAERAGFGARSYVSKVENPFGSNRIIPTIPSIYKFAIALNIEPMEIIEMAEREVGSINQDDLTLWWTEMVTSMKNIRREDWPVIANAAHRLSAKKTVAGGG